MIDLCRQSTRYVDQCELDHSQGSPDKDEADGESGQGHVGPIPSTFHSALDESPR